MASSDDVAWYRLDAAEALARLHSDAAQGLTEAEVATRLDHHGPNAEQERKRQGVLRMAVAQFSDFMILLLLAAAVVSGAVGDLRDTIVILAIVVMNAAVGVVQEYRAERAMAALKRMATPKATVVRAGITRTVPTPSVVPGDIVVLEDGSLVPADVRLLDATDLRLGEAALTGESTPIEKQVASRPERDLPVADRDNMAFKGTVVLHGRGRGVVVATGMQSELGRIAGMLQDTEATRTPLQQRLTRFGWQIALAAIAICILFLAQGLLRGEPPLTMLLTALSLAVAAVPEALPAVVTVLLALGAARMVRENALIRRLPAVETLGSVTTICSDKTGTLTLNRMQVVDVFVEGQRVESRALDSGRPAVAALLRALALSNNVDGPGGPNADADGPMGDPTEVALWQVALEAGFDKAACERDAPRVYEWPFDSERKRMTTAHRQADGVCLFTKGAPEAVIGLCVATAAGDGTYPLDRSAVTAAAEEMAQAGLRVLAIASRKLPDLPPHPVADEIEQELTFLGLVGLLDPPREEAAAAVAACRAAGIRPVMITGDHPATAEAVARRLGLMDSDGAVITGRDLAALSDTALEERVREISVYARVDPAQKIRIVMALQAKGEVVAMTGDGVNDAPALARAEIGIAMGRSGTDVARGAAGLVLLDDNFATIVTAVREGRRIYDNIRKFVCFIVACNAAEIMVVVLAPLIGLPVPLTATQILWINLVTDGLPGLALAAEPAEAGVMQRPPRPPHEGLFAQGMLWHVVWMGVLMAVVTLGAQAVAIAEGQAHWQTIVFTILTLSQMWQVMGIRTGNESLFVRGVLSNRPLLGAVLLTFALQMAVIYAPPLNAVFGTMPLSAAELLACVGLSSTVFLAAELRKWLIGRRRPAPAPAR
ncbi:MAG: cation-translocating P-type ATPase [Acetobacteraceae bacterium]